tara:strand:+ start:4625 stop:4909 length:285 start_codon:yes stop_codon:yes gene_type:complete
MTKVHHPKTRRYQLCVDKIETLEDIKKILDMMKIRIDTDNPDWEKVEDYFCLEVVPKGYMKLLQKIGQEGIAELHYYEIEQQALELLNEDEKTN